MKRTWVAITFVLMMGWAVPAAAQEDPAHEPDWEGCKDSPLITRMKGCRILTCEARDFDAYDVVGGAYDIDSGHPMKSLEGKVEQIEYVCAANLSGLQIARNMENAVKAAGFRIVTSHRVDQNHYLTVNNGPQWLEIRTEPWNSQFHYIQTSVLVQAMEQDVVADAGAMAAAIDSAGSVAIYGITFDTGKATFQPGSEQILAEMARLMRDRDELRFEVQGHTDNVGQKAANMTLSEARARAVVMWLTLNGIDPSRLVAKGYGDTVPVADNTSDEGRAKNRRVELKKIGSQ